MKRVFLAMSEGDLQYQSRDSKTHQSFSEGENLTDQKQSTKVPLASLLSHGGRVVMQIPPIKKGEKSDKFINWIMGGKVDEVKKSGVIMGRIAATHSIQVKNGEVRETRPMPKLKNAGVFIANAFKRRHMGMNIGLGEKDKAAADNGSNGHVYFYYLEPTKKSPGALMIGCEGSEPGKADRYGHKHDASGKSSDKSPTGGRKFRHMLEEAKGLPIPKEVDGLRVKFNEAKMNALTKMSADQFSLENLGLAAGFTKKVSASPEPVTTLKVGDICYDPNFGSVGIVQKAPTITNLVLEGGGTKAMSHMGVLESLQEKNVLQNIERVAGSSAGAITAMFLALGCNPEQIKKYSEQVSLNNLIENPNQSSMKQGMIVNFLKNASLVGDHLDDGAKLVAKMRDIISERVDELRKIPEIESVLGERPSSMITFNDLKKIININDRLNKEKINGDANSMISLRDLVVTGTKITVNEDGRKAEKVYFNADGPYGDMPILEALRISTAIPHYFKAVQLKNGKPNEFFVDGGVLNNYPMDVFNDPKYKPQLNADGVNLATLGVRFNRLTRSTR